MEKVVELLNRMQADGVIEKFAIGGGIAAIYYLEPHSTEGIDVFLSSIILDETGFVPLSIVDSYLESQGYHAEGEYIRIEDWLVKFLPASQPVQKEAVEQAVRVPFGATFTLIFPAEYLAAECLRLGRLKDNLTLIALLESDVMDMKTFRDVTQRHGLTEKWQSFVTRHDMEK